MTRYKILKHKTQEGLGKLITYNDRVIDIVFTRMGMPELLYEETEFKDIIESCYHTVDVDKIKKKLERYELFLVELS